MHATAQRRSDQNPNGPRKKTELCRQYRPNQRSRTSDGSKVMSENHPSVRWHIILVVVLQDCRRRSRLIENEHLCRQPLAVKTIANRQCAKSSGNDPECADLLAAR